MVLDWLERHLVAGHIPCFFWAEIDLLSGLSEEKVEGHDQDGQDDEESDNPSADVLVCGQVSVAGGVAAEGWIGATVGARAAAAAGAAAGPAGCGAWRRSPACCALLALLEQVLHSAATDPLPESAPGTALSPGLGSLPAAVLPAGGPGRGPSRHAGSHTAEASGP